MIVTLATALHCKRLVAQKSSRKRTSGRAASKAGARFVFTVPARQLTRGDYALTLSGITPQGEVDNLSKSLFRVVNNERRRTLRLF